MNFWPSSWHKWHAYLPHKRLRQQSLLLLYPTKQGVSSLHIDRRYTTARFDQHILPDALHFLAYPALLNAKKRQLVAEKLTTIATQYGGYHAWVIPDDWLVSSIIESTQPLTHATATTQLATKLEHIFPVAGADLLYDMQLHALPTKTTHQQWQVQAIPRQALAPVLHANGIAAITKNSLCHQFVQQAVANGNTVCFYGVQNNQQQFTAYHKTPSNQTTHHQIIGTDTDFAAQFIQWLTQQAQQNTRLLLAESETINWWQHSHWPVKISNLMNDCVIEVLDASYLLNPPDELHTLLTSQQIAQHPILSWLLYQLTQQPNLWQLNSPFAHE